MNKTRKLHLISLILNIAIVSVVIVGIATLRISRQDFAGGKIFLRYDVIAASITLLASALMIFANGVSIKRGKDATPKFFFNLKFIGSVMSAITLGLAIYYIVNNKITLTSPEALLYFVVPALTLVEFIASELEPECKFKKTFVPFLATILYVLSVIVVITVVAMKGKALGDAEFKEYINPFIPYDFFRLSPTIIFKDTVEEVTAALKTNAITLGLFVVISYAISFIIWSLNRITSSIVVGVTYTKKEEKEVIVKERVGTRIKKSFSTHTHEYDEGKVYHISYANRREKTWKVKGELAGRANKIFPTQKEAIEFANELVKKNGGSIRIHSMVGRIRKDW